MPPQNSCPIQRIQSYLAIRSYASIQACGATMSNEQQARKMLTSIAKTTGGFEYAGEYYAACCAFLSGTDPSMPSKALIQPNELNIDRLLKVTGGSSKMHTGDGLITKAKRDRAELQNCQASSLDSTSVTLFSNLPLALWLLLRLRRLSLRFQPRLRRLSLQRLSLRLQRLSLRRRPSRPSVRASRLRRPPRLAAFDLLIGLLVCHPPSEVVGWCHPPSEVVLVVRDYKSSKSRAFRFAFFNRKVFLVKETKSLILFKHIVTVEDR